MSPTSRLAGTRADSAPGRFILAIVACLLSLQLGSAPAATSQGDTLFQAGLHAFHGGDYVAAGSAFEESAAAQPSTGAWQNLGNVEWLRGHTGPAVLAWERSLWLDPRNQAARNNLRFARKNAQLEAPELAWYEVISTWLPLNAWPWLTGLSLWSAVGLGLLPGIFRLRKTSWHQGLAAIGLMVFLLSLPADLGLISRTRIGFVTQKDTLLRLTPTHQGEAITRLSAGDPGRLQKVRGGFVLIRAGRSEGWVEAERFTLICPR